jgi:hypothetical protein
VDEPPPPFDCNQGKICLLKYVRCSCVGSGDGDGDGDNDSCDNDPCDDCEAKALRTGGIT